MAVMVTDYITCGEFQITRDKIIYVQNYLRAVRKNCNYVDCNVVTQFGDEFQQCKDPDVRARGQGECKGF